MARTSPPNAIDYLVERRFPQLGEIRRPGGLGLPGDERLQQLREAERYRAALRATTPEELRSIFEQEQAKEAEASRLASERMEQERFFNRPDARADFDHWSRAAYWTLDEAIALAFGKAPEVVSWEKVQPYVNTSPFARQYARVRDLAIRAKNLQQLHDHVLPRVFLEWARRTEIALPEDLVNALEARGVTDVDWKAHYGEIKLLFDSVAERNYSFAAMCDRLIEEHDGLRARVIELEEQVAAWQFDDTAENYPLELDIANQAWWAVSRRRSPALSVKQQLLAWLEQSYPELTDEARKRIATVCNWGQRGGRPTKS